MSRPDPILSRYLAGRPLTAREGTFPYLARGDGRWTGWQRQAVRIAGPAAAVLAGWVAGEHPLAARVGAVALLLVGWWWLRRRWRQRRFRRAYVSPTVKAVRVALGTVDVSVRVDRQLGQLVARLARPMSPAEEWGRQRYGRWVEPVWRRPTDQAVRVWARGWRIVHPPIAATAAWLRPPGADRGPRVELAMATPYVAADQRKMISSIVGAKIPVADLAETWHQVGAVVTATWIPRRRPPTMVGADALATHGAGLQEWEYFLGLGASDARVVVSLHDDSPHLAISAGSGAGKSVLAQLIAVQVLRRGGQVVILDRKGSHRWALGLDRVDYCTQPAQMHRALVAAATLADERNQLALHEPDGWDPGPRVLVVCEELNATVGQLANHWADVRAKGDPKRSPAVNALNEVAYMGRSAKVNLLAVAQMLTARAVGGPEARENFGVRCLARYTANAWKMLVPEASMPRASRTLGRWQIVVGGQATETQVCYLTRAQARGYAAVTASANVPDGPLPSSVTDNRYRGNAVADPSDASMTLREAVDKGLLPWGYEATKMRLSRARGSGRGIPRPIGRRGNADLYLRGDLIAWTGQERGP